jgi:hypothetical protein
MYEHTIRVSIDAKEHADINKFLKLRAQVYDEFAPTLASLGKHPSSTEYGDVYALTERTCRELARLLVKVRGHKVAKLDSARLEVSLEAEAAQRAEWFVVAPETTMEIDGSSGGLVDVRADRIKGREALRRYSETPLVSEKWVTFAREAKLKGIDFLWARDKGKYQAPQWYTPIGTAFLGRGVDHPWFDPAMRGAYKADGFMIVQPTDPAWIIGVRTFDATQLRPKLRTDPPQLAELLGELRQMTAEFGAEVRALPCVLREFLPRTDFAYLRVAQPHEPGDRPHRTVRLCASAATRRKLIEARLATPADFRPVEVIDAAPPKAAVFDSRGDVPPPGVLTDKDLAQAHQTADKQRAKFDASPKPPMPIKPPESKKLVAKLKRRLKVEGSPIAKGASSKAIAAAAKKIGLAIPARWAELLGAVDGFVIDNCYALDSTAELRVAAVADLPETHENDRQMIGSDDLSATHLGVANSDIGDCIFLDTGRVTKDGDSPVLFVNHETLQTEMTWPAIGLFLSDALEATEE